MYKKLFVLSLITSTLLTANHDIIYMISPPRTLSTAFLSMMHARGDCKTFAEPSQFAWNHKESPEFSKQHYRPDVFTSGAHTFEQAKKLLFDAAQDSLVFAKEMSFAVNNFLKSDLEFIKNPRVHFVFLLRNPHHATISHYQVLQSVPRDFSYFMGYKALYELYTLVKKHSSYMPYVIFTEDLYHNPEDTVKRFCEQVGIPYIPKALQWESKFEDAGITAWGELKYKESAQAWHGVALRSTGFSKPAEYEVDAQGKPTFSEVTNQQDRAALRIVYEENLKYYQLFMKELESV